MRDGRAWGPTIFFLVVALSGSFIMLITDRIQAIAQDWPPTPCVIESSQLSVRGRNRFGDLLFRIDIVYAYTQNGRSFRSNCYDLWDSSNDHNGMLAVVAAYPTGRHTICFVDPINPTRALLNRTLPPSYILLSLLGATLLLAAITGLLIQFWLAQTGTRPSSSDGQSPPAHHAHLRLQSSPPSAPMQS